MELTRYAFLGLLGAVGMLRLVELRISRRNQRRLLSRGALRAEDPSFPWMVLLHAGLLAGAAAEVFLLRRPFLPFLAATMGAVFLAANGLRWWVIRTLGEHWSVQVIDAEGLGVITTGPYRWVRHPNYIAVFAEMLALPLIHTAWLTAVFGGAAHLAVLGTRVRAEDRVLLADPEYLAKMGGKPRFLPRLFSASPAGKRPALPGRPTA
ncbi:MAG TPA: isoprenylcysteine carboxylmethyltransferase family protein [Candidatus Acidoferrales bacterium]|nr:isoprenylcysteine carboxylmethyltransferase family protein [Candidatus Acidoferrales bacterium]